MAEVRWTPWESSEFRVRSSKFRQAMADFVAQDSPHYASLFVLDVLQAIERLNQFRKLGRIVPETSDPVIRELILGNYRIVYRLKFDTPEILTIYHGSRLLDTMRLK